MSNKTDTEPREIVYSMRHAWGPNATFVLICFVMGVVIGCAAWLLKYMIAGISHALTGYLAPQVLPWTFFFVPVLAIMIVGAAQKYILHHRIDRSTDRINDALVKRQLDIPLSTVFSPMMLASITLGAGGSAGAEGPIAYSGAAMGSNLARMLKLGSKAAYALVAIGAGAGIAGIFKAPVGGMLFTIEILSFSFNTLSVVGLVVACLASGLIATVVDGFTPDMLYLNPPQFEVSLIAWAVPLGIVCGTYSYFYAAVVTRLGNVYRSIDRPWVRWLSSGSALAVMLFVVPSFYGEGYNVVSAILSGHGAEALTFSTVLRHLPSLSPWVAMIVMATAIVLFKPAAVASTNSGGGIAGDFAPTLFAGAGLGFLFAAVAVAAMGADVAQGALVFMAMGGVMAGSVKAPVMAMFIVSEMSAVFTLFIPLAVTCVISYLVVCAITAVSVGRIGRRA